MMQLSYAMSKQFGCQVDHRRNHQKRSDKNRRTQQQNGKSEPSKQINWIILSRATSHHLK